MMRINILLNFKNWISKNRFVFSIILAGFVWEVLVFYRFPKEAWVDGLMQSWYMSQGLVIYKDTASMYFPVLYLLMIPFHQLFGFTQTPTLLLAPINSLLLLILLTIVSLRWLKGWYRVLPLILFLIWEPYLGANRFASTAFLNTVTFIVFILWWKWYQGPRKVTAFLMGLFLGISLLTVQIVGLFVMVIMFSIFFKCWRDRKHLDSLICVLTAFLLPIIFVLLWLISHGALSDFWTRTIAYYFAESGYPYSMGRELNNILIFIAIFSSLVLIVRKVQLHLCQRCKENNLSQEFFLVLILLSFLLPFWFAIFHYSRFQTSLAICSFIFGFAVQQILKSKKQDIIFNKVLLAVVLIFNVFGIYQVLIPKYKTNFTYPKERVILTKIQKDDPFFEVIEWVKKNTPEQAKILAMTDSLIYLETKRLPVNSHATSNLPVAYEPLDQFKLKIRNQPPAFWVIDERQWKRFHEFGYAGTASFLQEILKCEPVVARIEYITIRKHVPGSANCL